MNLWLSAHSPQEDMFRLQVSSIDASYADESGEWTEFARLAQHEALPHQYDDGMDDYKGT